jgi:hypothetical protein
MPKSEITIDPSLHVCYVTAKPGVQLYEFGGHVTIPLTQFAFAHFVLRANANSKHMSCIPKMLNLERTITGLLEGVRDDFQNGSCYEGTVDAQIEAGRLDLEKLSLLAEKARSGVDIVNQLREEFRTTGKLVAPQEPSNAAS